MRPDDPRTWLHAHDCACSHCPPAAPQPAPPIGWVELSRLAFLGMAGGAATAMLCDPAGSGRALASLVGLG